MHSGMRRRINGREFIFKNSLDHVVFLDILVLVTWFVMNFKRRVRFDLVVFFEADKAYVGAWERVDVAVATVVATADFLFFAFVLDCRVRVSAFLRNFVFFGDGGVVVDDAS